MPPARRGTRKGPTDLTGREDERLKSASQAELDDKAETTAMVATARRRRDKGVVDYTDESRPKVETKPAEAKPIKESPRIVRILADIDRMTFGKEIIDYGDFTDPHNPRMPQVGSLKEYNFKEGREYKVDYPLYVHLRDLGYVYDYDDEDEDEGY